MTISRRTKDKKLRMKIRLSDLLRVNTDVSGAHRDGFERFRQVHICQNSEENDRVRCAFTLSIKAEIRWFAKRRKRIFILVRPQRWGKYICIWIFVLLIHCKSVLQPSLFELVDVSQYCRIYLTTRMTISFSIQLTISIASTAYSASTITIRKLYLTMHNKISSLL